MCLVQWWSHIIRSFESKQLNIQFQQRAEWMYIWSEGSIPPSRWTPDTDNVTNNLNENDKKKKAKTVKLLEGGLKLMINCHWVCYDWRNFNCWLLFKFHACLSVTKKNIPKKNEKITIKKNTLGVDDERHIFNNFLSRFENNFMNTHVYWCGYDDMRMMMRVSLEKILSLRCDGKKIKR